MRCDLPENVPECTYHKRTKEQKKLKEPIECTGPGLFANPDEPKQYFECKEENSVFKLYTRHCLHKHTFNEILKMCDEKFIEIVKIEEKCQPNNYAPDHHDCQRFYHCHNGEPKTPLYCPRGYIFTGNQCEHEDNTPFCDWELIKLEMRKSRQ